MTLHLKCTFNSLLSRTGWLLWVFLSLQPFGTSWWALVLKTDIKCSLVLGKVLAPPNSADSFTISGYCFMASWASNLDFLSVCSTCFNALQKSALKLAKLLCTAAEVLSVSVAYIVLTLLHGLVHPSTYQNQRHRTYLLNLLQSNWSLHLRCSFKPNILMARSQSASFASSCWILDNNTLFIGSRYTPAGRPLLLNNCTYLSSIESHIVLASKSCVYDKECSNFFVLLWNNCNLKSNVFLTWYFIELLIRFITCYNLKAKITILSVTNQK